MASSLIAGRLPGFLGRASRTPFVWGGHDCLLWLADWLLQIEHPDAAAQWRGHYATQLGAARILRRHGGLVGLVDAGVAGLLDRTNDPHAGDIAVVRVLTGRGPSESGAIRTSIGWAVLSTKGLWVSSQLQPIAAWRA